MAKSPNPTPTTEAAMKALRKRWTPVLRQIQEQLATLKGN